MDVQSPSLDEVVAALPPGEPAVIVPLLLSLGHHVHHDIHHAAAPDPTRSPPHRWPGPGTTSSRAW
ncbi:hypothetical protein GY12_17950 [Micrococcus luteus]|nr:hypothetical protein GY12_17950 [Micrococcus luteus]